MHQMVAAVDGLDSRSTTGWSSSSARVPYPQPEHSTSVVMMPLPQDYKADTISRIETHHYHGPPA
jgi:hypothetical protein